MMVVMEGNTPLERKHLRQNIKPRMLKSSINPSHIDPNIKGEEVHVADIEREEGGEAKDGGLGGGGVVAGEGEGDLELVVLLVDELVEGGDVEDAVEDVVGGVLDVERKEDVEEEGPQRGELVDGGVGVH